MPKVPLQSLTFASLGDGFNGRMIDELLATISQDILDRNGDPRPRKLVITCTFDPDTQHNRVNIGTEYNVKLPTFRPPGTQAKIDERAGGFVFNSDNAENVEQNTINDVVNEHGEVHSK